MVRSGNGANGDQSGPSANTTHHSAGDDLAGRLSDLARSLQHEESVDETLQAIAHAAVGTVPGAQYAALSVVEHRRAVYTRAGTAELVFKVDRVQYDTGEGPCLSAVYEQQTVRLPDMTTEARWPQFTRRTAELGVLSMLSFQLYVQQDNLGALNLYSADKNAFSEDSEHIGLLFASHAAVAMSGAQQQEHLHKAIAARDLIGQAKGILMERYKMTADQAF
jgi:transcriptional regulator with GAF, ATPase, and Fis domain